MKSNLLLMIQLIVTPRMSRPAGGSPSWYGEKKLEVFNLILVVSFLWAAFTARSDRSSILIGLPGNPLTTLEDQPVAFPFQLRIPASVDPQSVTVAIEKEGTVPVSSNLALAGQGANWTLSVYPALNFNGKISANLVVRAGKVVVLTELIEVFISPVDDPVSLFPVGPPVVLMEGGAPTKLSLAIVNPDRSAFVTRVVALREPAPFTADFSGGLLLSPAGELTPAMAPFTRMLAVVTENATYHVTNFVPVTVRQRQFRPAKLGDGHTPKLGNRVALADIGRGISAGLNLVTGGPTNATRVYTFDPEGGLKEDLLESIQAADLIAPGDFNGDGRVDLAVATGSGTNTQLAIYSNQATAMLRSQLIGGFKDHIAGVIPADFDRDGDTDIRFQSGIDIGLISNRASGSLLEKALSGVVGVTHPFSFRKAPLFATGDLDSDGIPDVVGARRFGVLTLQFSSGSVPAAEFPFQTDSRTRHAMGLIDVDGDGRLDLWEIAGPQLSHHYDASYSSTKRELIVSRVEGRRVTELHRGPAMAYSSPVLPAWGDFDGNGSLDFVAPDTETSLRIFLNDGAGHFAPGPFVFGLPSFNQGFNPDFPQLAAGDVNGDGLMDVVVGGEYGGVLLQQGGIANIPPSAPLGLRAEIHGSRLTLFWLDAFDLNQQAQLSYNVRVGTRPGANDILPSLSAVDGTRLVAQPGNAGYETRLELDLSNREVGDLYWSVQAVDNGWAGGAWSFEETVRIGSPVGPPSISALADIEMDEDTDGQALLQVSDGATPGALLQVAATSTNTTLIARIEVLPQLEPLGIPHDDGARRLRIIPQPNAHGSAVVVVTVTDRAGLTTRSQFTVAVRPSNDPPAILVDSPQLALRGQPSEPLAVQVADVDSESTDLSLRLGTIGGNGSRASANLTRVGDRWALVVSPGDAETREVNVELVASDGLLESRRVIVCQFEEVQWTGSGRILDSPGAVGGFQIADFDGDGSQELLSWAKEGAGGRVVVTTLAGRRLYEGVVPGVDTAAVGDANEDGAPDLWLGIRESADRVGGIQVYLNRGDGTFETQPSLPLFARRPFIGQLEPWDADHSGHRHWLVGFDRPGNPFLDRVQRSLLLRWSATSYEVKPLFGTQEAGMLSPVGTSEFEFLGDGTSQLLLKSSPAMATVYSSSADSLRLSIPGLTDGPGELIGLGDFNGDGQMDWVERRGEVHFQISQADGAHRPLTLPGATRVEQIMDLDGDGRSEVLYRTGDRWARAGLGAAGDLVLRRLPEAVSALADLRVGDLNGDGVLDLIGRSGAATDPTTRVVAFLGASASTPPALRAPRQLRAAVGPGTQVLLSWALPPGSEPASGYTYAVRVGTAPGESDRLQPDANFSGARQLARPGPVGGSRKYLLKQLAPGQTYYWTVQAISPGFRGGEFAAEQSFRVPADSNGSVVLKVSREAVNRVVSIPFGWSGSDQGLPPTVRVSTDNALLVPRENLRLSLGPTTGLVEVLPIQDREGAVIVHVDVEVSATVDHRQSFSYWFGFPSGGSAAVVRRTFEIGEGDRFSIKLSDLDSLDGFRDLSAPNLLEPFVRVADRLELYPESMPSLGRWFWQSATGPVGRQLGLELNCTIRPAMHSQLFLQRDGGLGFVAVGAPNSFLAIEVSEDLLQWRPLGNYSSGIYGSKRTTNWHSGSAPGQFFRVRN